MGFNQKWAICGWVISLFVAPGIFFYLSQPPRLRVIACDVGQGDAIVVQYGETLVLLDSGPNSNVLRCLQAKNRWIDPVLDLLVLSHPDSDHIGGVSSLREQYRIPRVWWNGQRKDTKVFLENADWLDQVGTVPTPGDQIVFPGLRLRLVWNASVNRWAFPEVEGEGDANSGSLGVFLTGESFGFLSLGDLECRQELAVASIGLLNRVSILKISHHGSKFSSCLDFLQKILPETALISVGVGNSYGHPDPISLKNLQFQAVTVLRTDQLGDIELVHSGTKWLRKSASRK